MIHRRTFLGATLGAAAATALPQMAGAKGPAKPPFRLYDTHAHFYTNDFARYPIDGSTARYGAEALIAKATKFPQTPEVVFKGWDATGVVKGCGVQYGSAYSNDNRYLLDISKQHPKRIVPVVILDPVAPDTPATIERMTRQDKISGVRFRGMPNMPDGTHNFLTAPSAPVWEMANKLGIVVVLMAHSRKVEDRRGVMTQVADLATRYPNVIIVLDHMGFPVPGLTPTYGFYPEHLALIEHRNVYFKYTQLLIEQLTAAKVPRGAFMDYANRTFGANRMMWGSDVGNSEGTMEEFVHLALESTKGLSIRDQRTLYFDTPERLFVPGGRGPRSARG